MGGSMQNFGADFLNFSSKKDEIGAFLCSF